MRRHKAAEAFQNRRPRDQHRAWLVARGFEHASASAGVLTARATRLVAPKASTVLASTFVIIVGAPGIREVPTPLHAQQPDTNDDFDVIRYAWIPGNAILVARLLARLIRVRRRRPVSVRIRVGRVHVLRGERGL